MINLSYGNSLSIKFSKSNLYKAYFKLFIIEAYIALFNTSRCDCSFSFSLKIFFSL